MKILKASEFLRRKDTKPFLLGAFYSRIISVQNDKYFATTSSFKTSKYVYEMDFDLEDYKSNEYLDRLNYFSGHPGWFYKKNNSIKINGLPRADLIFLIENDLNQTQTTFFKTLQTKIYSSDWAHEDGLTESKKFFIRGFFELRASIDTNRPLIAQDYFFNSQKEISKAKLLIDFLDVPLSMLNINFRELQNQYVSGENQRNTQLRADLYWYIQNIGLINKYKAKIYENRYYYSEKIVDDFNITYFVCPQTEKKDTNTFIQYINYFANNVSGKELTPVEIQKIRDRLGFNTLSSDSMSRNQKIIELYRNLSEDKCAICGTTQTYLNKKTGRQHFEIHHMISFKNGKELDVYDNLVKLCPTCHDMMKKSSGVESDQIKAIEKILNENDTIYEFCSTYLGIENIPELSIKIQSLLG